ncbi:MAG: AMP-binding protein [Pseudomonadota bacterium]|nr:AMP-binding protein [Pseudomonadota bacterium]
MNGHITPMKTPIEVLSLYPPHDGTLKGLVASRAQRDPARPFLIFKDRTWSWGEFQKGVDDTARMLAGQGIGRGERVAVMATNSDRFVLMFFALARLGAVLVPINPDFGPAEAGYVLNHAGAAAVACTAATLAVARQASEGMARKPWFMLLEGEDPAVPGFDALLAKAPSASLPEDVGLEDICLTMYTSGTTGFPKGVMHSQRNFVMAGEGFVERMYLQADDRVLCILPLFHINALFYSLGGATAAGASIVFAPRFSASGFWPLVAQSGATEVNIIAAVGNILARRPRAEFVPGHKLVKVYGAPVTQEIYDAFRKDFGVPTIIEGYGMTEIPGACNLPFTGPHKIGSMGRPALHPDRSIRFAELRVVDDDGNEVADGETGELLVRTPIVMKGYYKDPEQTAAAFRDGWFVTGDLVRREPDGFYHFVARKKDIIRKRGENISGAELDRIIGEHPGVMEAAAIAVPSELGEDEILVAVVPRPGAKVEAADIRDWCEQRLAAIKVPRYVVFAESLPQTPTHRVAKFKLKADKALLSTAIDLNTLKKGK